ncbi:MAG: hypothetical protein JWR09_5862 [Mucilaginibacter sp.]|nr:hypothetical protein [Mucilaginibacter sp.]
MIAERLIEEKRWVEEFLRRLEGFVRETKH